MSALGRRDQIPRRETVSAQLYALERFGVVNSIETFIQDTRRVWRFSSAGGREHVLLTNEAETFIAGAFAARTALQIRNARTVREALEGDSNDAEHDALASVATDLGVRYELADDLSEVMAS